MLVTRKSLWSGITRTVDLPITEQQLNDWENNGALAQVAFSNLTEAQREFIISGMTEEEWEEMSEDVDQCGDIDGFNEELPF